MLHLQRLGCANVEPVSPSHHLPGLLEALAIAVDAGLSLPVVYNTNAYESLETLELLDGIVDIYLPDIKYADDDIAAKYSDADNYVDTARTAILVMSSQVQDLVVGATGRALRGLILRHLVLPEDLSGTDATLRWASEQLPRTVTLSLMAQYAPLHRAKELPPLDRKLTAQEYDRAVNLAWDLGFHNAFVQDLESTDTCVPDFTREEPFDWPA
jgi:putative pyruvate formate lyase activating enzyme